MKNNLILNRVIKSLLILIGVIGIFFTPERSLSKPRDLFKIKSTGLIEKRLRIAVIDTGISEWQVNKPYMCKDIPFVVEKNAGFFDKQGHGTNVVGLIGNQINTSKYCITSYGLNVSTTMTTMEKYLSMLIRIQQNKPFAINVSWSAVGYDAVEFRLLKYYTDTGVQLIVAAGNNANKLTKDDCNAYPACHALNIKKNFTVVGSLNPRYTNWGPVVSKFYPGDNIGYPAMTGTSQATANYTGFLFSE